MKISLEVRDGSWVISTRRVGIVVQCGLVGTVRSVGGGLRLDGGVVGVLTQGESTVAISDTERL